MFCSSVIISLVGSTIVGASLDPTYFLVYSDDMKRVAETQISRDDEESVESQDSEEVCVHHALQVPSNPLFSTSQTPGKAFKELRRLCWLEESLYEFTD